VTQSLRELLLRRLNQAFWLLLLMVLAGWGAWRFSSLAAPAVSVSLTTKPPLRKFQQLQLQSITSLDSSVNLLRFAMLTGEPETVLLNLTEQIRQQSQEVTLLSTSGRNKVLTKPSDSQTVLLDQCQAFRKLLIRKASVRLLSQHLAVFQSQVRHLQYRIDENLPE
jgi:hypothetical protein